MLTGGGSAYADTVALPTIDPPQYARFCSGEDAATATTSERNREASQGVQLRLHLPRAPHVVARNAHRMFGKPGDAETTLVTVADMRAIRITVGFAREIAAYMLFNDADALKIAIARSA